MTRPVGLYVHWPFCHRICPYCDFTVARAREVDAPHWQRQLVEDLHFWRDRYDGGPLHSIYFGGGTPSLMPPALVSALLSTADSLFGTVAHPEVTLEMNPTDAEAGKLAGFAAAGINRVSIGVQSFDDRQLKFLGRNHSGSEARLAVDIALSTLSRVSLDFIYALPDEAPERWAERLRQATKLGAGHLSLYQLTIEPQTPFSLAVGRGDWTPPDEDVAADLYDLTQEITSQAGYVAYEVSNHAKGEEVAIHNSLYWSDADWLAIGPGAHGRLTAGEVRVATEGLAPVKAYAAAPRPEARYRTEELSATDVAIERIAGSLRRQSGLRSEELPPAVVASLENVRRALVAEGLMHPDADVLMATRKGRPLIDYIVRQLVSAI